MDYDKLIHCLKCCARVDAQNEGCDDCDLEYCGEECQQLCGTAATAIETLRAELARVTAERDGAIRKYEAEKEDFLDYALSGTRNAAPFCRNRHPDCVDKRGWCIPVKCHGFSRDKEDT